MTVDVDAVIADHEARIERALPEARTLVTGSTLLGGFRGRDIDLVVLVPDVRAAADRIRDLYQPLYEDYWRDDWAFFRDPGSPQVDVVLTVEGSPGDVQHRGAWELILGDDELRAEFERLEAEGMSDAAKGAYFERVAARLT
jgi:hypothetical protein